MRALSSSVALLLVSVSAVSALAGAPRPGTLVWPLDGHDRITAGFCDYRARHFHGGIDISTDGREGLPVRAADSSWVMRVSTSWWGYGKAVYVRLAQGGVAVYGHLSDFSPAIAAYVEEEQYASERYQQNLLPAPGQLPVACGEVIGKTGQTGVGPPHLHFELRTDGNRPINPIAWVFPQTDKISPTIVSLTFVPRQPQDLTAEPSMVDGSLLPVTLPTADVMKRAAIPVSGEVGVAVLVRDRVDSTGGIITPYKVLLLANGEPACEVRYDSINYDQTRLIDLERVYDPKPGIDPRAICLFRRQGNSLWEYTSVVDDGWLVTGRSLPDGDTSTISVEVEDAAGNRTVAAVRLLPVDKPGPVRDAQAAHDTFDIEPAWNGLVLSRTGTTPGKDYCPVAVGNRCLPGWPGRQGVWSFWIPALPGLDTVWLDAKDGGAIGRRTVPLSWMAVASEEGGTLPSPDGAASVTIGPDGLYESTFLVLRLASKGNAASAMTPFYEFAPADIPLARDARLSISSASVNAPTDKLAIYRYLGKTAGWDFAGKDRDTDAGTISATIPRTGSYALLVDTTPPSIRKVTPGKGATIKERRPTIRFVLGDDLSGLGSDADVRMTIDGRWVPVEYDPDLGTAMARPRWELDRGEHRVEITAQDRMGNQSSFTRVFRTTP
ncbi:MAG: M23 family metallopeptidase [Candidatus Zixiibacteriota bacterium]